MRVEIPAEVNAAVDPAEEGPERAAVPCRDPGGGEIPLGRGGGEVSTTGSGNEVIQHPEDGFFSNGSISRHPKTGICGRTRWEGKEAFEQGDGIAPGW